MARGRRERLRAGLLDQAGIPGVTPHRFRRTAATAINELGGLQLASEILGHSDPAITRENYIRRNETVNPITAEFLEQAFGSVGGSRTSPEANARNLTSKHLLSVCELVGTINT